MSEQKKDNAKLKEEFKNTLGNDKLDVETYRQMVDYIKNNKNIDIECVVINTGEGIAKQKYGKDDRIVECDEEKLWEDDVTKYYIADKQGNDTRIEQSKKLKQIIFKKSDKPYGVMVLMVNNQGHLQHARSFIIIAPPENDNSKRTIIPIEARKRDDSFLQADKEYFGYFLAACLENTSFDLKPVRLGSTIFSYIITLYNLFKDNLEDRIDFLYPKQYPVMKDATCFFYELMMLTKLLKNQGKEIDKLIKAEKGTQIKFPLSIMKYTQIDRFIDYLEKNYENKDEKTQKQLNKVEQGKFTFNDNEGKKKTHNTLIYSKALKLSEKLKQQQDQAQHINKFVKDNRVITAGDITADNLISYFKQEKDRSRSFFWMFGQRNKRFNALCEALEVVGIQNPEQLFRRNANAEDEKQIRDLFDEQQQGNNANQEIQNNRPQLTTGHVKQRIVDRLNQVGCCSCG